MISFGKLALPTWILPSARLRVALTYLWSMHRLPDFERPKRFTEWVQHRKLFDRDPAFDMLTDKQHSKVLARAALGDAHVVPTAWIGKRMPLDPPAPLPLIVKSNHGSSQYLVVRTLDDWQEARRIAPRWLRREYGRWLDEWHYRAARRVILVEPLLGGEGAGLPVDYKVYVFGGRAELVQAHVGRGRHHRWTQFDRAWLPLSEDPVDLPPPTRLHAMLAAAETLSQQRDFIRVDFYEIAGQLWFGEFCLYPGSGLDPFAPDALDFELGRKWAEARSRPVQDGETSASSPQRTFA